MEGQLLEYDLRFRTFYCADSICWVIFEGPISTENYTFPIYGFPMNPSEISNFPANANMTKISHFRTFDSQLLIVRNSQDSVFVITIETAFLRLEKRSLDLTQVFETYPDYHFEKTTYSTASASMVGSSLLIAGQFSDRETDVVGFFLLIFDGASFK